MKLLGLCLIVLMGFSCATPKKKLTSKGEKVHVHGLKPKNCKIIGKVTGVSPLGSRELALNHARNLGGEEGANGIFVNEVVVNGNETQLKASIYQCD